MAGRRLSTDKGLRITGMKNGGKEGNVLFNNALNTFYLPLCGVIHMVKDHSESERGNPLPPHGLIFKIIAARVLLYASYNRQDNTYHGLCYTSRGALAGTRNSSMGEKWRDVMQGYHEITRMSP